MPISNYNNLQVNLKNSLDAVQEIICVAGCRQVEDFATLIYYYEKR